MINERKAKFVIRLTKNDYVKERQKMKKEDEIVEIEYDRHRKHDYKKNKPELYEK